MTTWKTNSQSYGSHFNKRATSEPKQKVGKSTLQYLESLDKGGFIHQQQNIAKRERQGLFSQPVGVTPGDPYRDPQIYKPEKGIQVNQRLHQKVGPQLFSKQLSTNLGDPYKDPFRVNQLYQKQKTDMSIHPQTFAAGGKQKFVKHSEFQHMKQFPDKQFDTRDENGKVKTGLKALYSGNMKKGYGNTTVGHLFSSYPYQGYPEDEGRAKDSNERLIHKAKIPTSFKGSSYPNATFIPNYAVYNNQEPYQQKKQDETFRGKSLNQWKYNNANKKGYNGTFTAFPKYIDEGEKEKAPLKEQKIWIHNFNGTSKGTGETLARPCPAPSQMLLNQKKRTKV